jgi:hypothetical protein
MTVSALANIIALAAAYVAPKIAPCTGWGDIGGL